MSALYLGKKEKIEEEEKFKQKQYDEVKSSKAA